MSKRRKKGGLRRLTLLVALLVVGPVLWKFGGRWREPVAFDWRAGLAERLDWADRAAWKAREPLSEPPALGQPSRVTIHHSGGEHVYRRRDSDGVAASIRAIQRDHQERRGWADIGYHFVIDPAGRLWEGREGAFTGAHAGSAELNESNLGILLLGNFEKQEPTAEQLDQLEVLLKALREVCAISAEEIHSHNEIRTGAGLAGTLCPGKHLTRHLSDLRR